MKSFKIVVALFMIVHHVNSQGRRPGTGQHPGNPYSPPCIPVTGQYPEITDYYPRRPVYGNHRDPQSRRPVYSFSDRPETGQHPGNPYSPPCIPVTVVSVSPPVRPVVSPPIGPVVSPPVRPGGDAPNITLYSELNQLGSATTVKGPVSDTTTKTKSISGIGLWFLYLHPDFKMRFKVIASGIITKQNLDPVHQDQLSSLRNAGSDDMSVEILTMYNEPDQCNASYIVVENMDILLGFNDEASSFAITGNSAWTLYPEPGYRGQATCIKPHVDHGFFYGYWNAHQLKIGDKEVSSVRKGCYSPHIFAFLP